MKRGLLVMVLCLVCVFAATITANAADKVKLIFAGPVPATDPLGWAGTGKPWSEAVKKRAGDRFELVEHHGGALISSSFAMLKGLGSGIADVGAIVLSYHPAQIRMGTLHSIMHPSLELGSQQSVLICRVLMQEFPIYEEDLAKNNLMNLFNITGVSYQLFSNRPVQTLDDFKGLKIRSFGSVIPIIVKAIDGVPVSIAYTEALDALHKRVLDATFGNPVDALSLGWFEVASNLTLLGNKGLAFAVGSGYSYALNLKTWNGIPDDLKRIMLEEAKRVEIEWGNYVENEAGPKAIADLKEKGVKFYDIPESEMKKWGERCPDIFGDVAAKLNAAGAPGTEVVNRFMELKELPIPELKALWEKAWDKRLAELK